MDCTCSEWKRNIPWVGTALKLVCVPGSIPVSPFGYCPWCGKIMVATTTTPPIGGGEHLISPFNDSEFRHGR